LRHAQGFLDFYNSNLFTHGANEADLWDTNAVIDAGIADLVLLIDMPLATPSAPKAPMEMQMQKSFTRQPIKAVDAGGKLIHF
jgi:hypothetical protein